jgi:hypothetical protein
MTSEGATTMNVDPTRCPDCGEPLRGTMRCTACGLLLRGPDALRLWQVSTDIDRLERERLALLDVLRRQDSPAQAAPRPASPAPAERREPAAAYRWTPPPPPKPRKEWTPQRVQNVLLATGALLLVVAAIAFTAFTWGRLPIAARGAIMLAVTGVTGWSAHWVLRRGLDASAEAIGLLAVLFGAVDAYAAHRADLGGLGGTDPATYWSVASGVLAAGAAGFARVVPVRSVRYAALAGVQLPLLITAFRVADLSYAQRGAYLVVQAAALLGAAHRLGGTALPARVCALANWSCGVLLALATAYGTTVEADVRLASVVLVAAGAVALLWPGDRTVTTGITTLGVVVAAVAPARLSLTFVQLPAAISAIGLLALVTAANAPRAWRRGPVAVGAATVAVAVAFVAPWVAQAVFVPLSWVAEPWGLRGDVAARAALGAGGVEWGGSVVTLAVVAVATLAAFVTAEALDRRRDARWYAVVLASVAVVLVPLGFASSYRAALTWYVTASLAALAASYVFRRWVVAVPATIVLAVATAWSLADRHATLVVLLAVALAYAAFATAYDTLRDPSAGIASAAAAGYVVALAASRGTPADRIGFLLATAAFGLLAAAWVLRGRVTSVEYVAGAAYAVGLGLSTTGTGWLAWTLGGGALAVGATAFRPERRRLAGLAAVLTAACAATTSAAYGLEPEQAAFVVAAVACALFAAGVLVRLEDVAAVGAMAYAGALVVSAGDVEWLAYALGIGALTAGAAAYRDRVLAPVAAALGIAFAGVEAYVLGAPLDRTGFVVAVCAAAAVGLGALLRGEDGDRVEVVAAVAYVVALGLTVPDLGWLSWVLAVGGLTCLADALREERRWLNWAATVLLTAWTWDRLWIEDVTVPEAYAAPVAVLTLALGHLRRRRDPSTGSWQAYGRGLAAAFATTTYLVLTDPGVTRPVLLAVAGAAVLLAGVRERLQAPLTVGAVALAVDALVQLAPMAAALPKWATIGATGLLVIAVGVTYEDRRRDVARLRQTFDSLA